MQMKYLWFAVPVLGLLTLASCGLNPGNLYEENDRSNTSMNGDHSDGQVRGRGPRMGSGARFGSGGMNTMMTQLSAEDQTLFKQMIDARRSGDSTTADATQSQLEAKYPNLNPGIRGGMRGSGSTMSSMMMSGTMMDQAKPMMNASGGMILLPSTTGTGK